MRKLALLAFFAIPACLFKPQFRSAEKNFSVETRSTSVSRGGLINAYIEARNPTDKDVRLVSVCDFYEDEILITSTMTEARIGKREIKIIRLNAPYGVGRLTRNLRISCTHKGFFIKQALGN